MDERDAGRGNRPPVKRAGPRSGRGRRIVKPLGWARYMIAKRLKSGQVAYYWSPRNIDIKRGFVLHREALGTDYSEALARAEHLNAHLDSWRAGQGADRSLDLSPRFGTVDWWLETYFRSTAFEKLKERTKPSYRYQLRLFAEVSTKNGGRLGDLHAKSITPAAVDKIYEKLRGGKFGKKFRTANHTTDIARKAWNVVQRTHPQHFVGVNPFFGLTRLSKTSTIQKATREEAYALSDAIKSDGHPHLAIVPLVCFEWYQRPENILAGYLRWTDYRPSERPNHVRIVHHKTDEVVWHPLDENGQRFYPELEVRLAELVRMAIPIVVTPGKRGIAHRYSFSYANRIVRKAARAAGIPEHVTMEACRHGGLTELGDAQLTEQEEMSLSGHRSPDALRRYIKMTEQQRLSATRKRRAWVLEEEHARNASQNNGQKGESERRR